MKINVILLIALKNLFQKSKRSIITIGGLSVAISVVVILVSLGYGLENIVVKSFTSQDAMRVIDVTAEKSDQIILDDGSIQEFLKMDSVQEVYPIVEVGAKILFNNSTTDVAVIAVPSQVFKYWNTFKIQNSDNLSKFNNNEVILSKGVMNILSVGDNDIGSKVELEMSVSQFKDGGNFIKDEFNILDFELNSESPIVFIPITYLQNEIIKKYSMVKIVVRDEKYIDNVRLILERMGYKTVTTFDTVAQIENIFSILRTALSVFGLVAAFVASLGMFNTLSVSHLEKTREIGIMKALGAQGNVILKLFLTEAVIMSAIGGFTGILGGVFLSKIIQFLLSIIASSRNYKMENIFVFPYTFLLGVFVTSIFIGILTGIYPSYKASKTSALDALRYE